ncbi:hypothetical protein, partial [Rickettsia asembonensis]|uniref:hypothetical protein n=2 Tax=Rickettsia asembonensis TaxID=1068590 RepID=UPI001F51F366
LWEKKSSIDTQSVEMVITMVTSQNASSISHIGIAKAPIYDYTNTKKHSSLSLKLHSFIAKCAEIIYPNKKEYMITVPTKNMTHIIIKEYEKKGILDKIYIGHQDTKIQQGSLEELKSKYQNTKCTRYEEQEHEPLITCDLETLANLSFKNSHIEYEYYSEVIGDTII